MPSSNPTSKAEYGELRSAYAGGTPMNNKGKGKATAHELQDIDEDNEEFNEFMSLVHFHTPQSGDRTRIGFQNPLQGRAIILEKQEQQPPNHSMQILVTWPQMSPRGFLTSEHNGRRHKGLQNGLTVLPRIKIPTSLEVVEHLLILKQIILVALKTLWSTLILELRGEFQRDKEDRLRTNTATLNPPCSSQPGGPQPDPQFQGLEEDRKPKASYGNSSPVGQNGPYSSGNSGSKKSSNCSSCHTRGMFAL
ncbi:hypothetical protein DFH09DRAFT_1088583 [Mycena vulgaris]|nr:hypothetical protein DFH09DRAFT_1088583 [Mycena vulgaris]